MLNANGYVKILNKNIRVKMGNSVQKQQQNNKFGHIHIFC
jgi:hypothetical protein